MKWEIRQEKPTDYQEVENVTREALWNVHGPGSSEHKDFVPELVNSGKPR